MKMASKQKMHERVAAATVKFTKKSGGQGVLVPGHLIVTAAHVIGWTAKGGQMAYSMFPKSDFYEAVRTAAGRDLILDPVAVEPVSDLAILGMPDDPAPELQERIKAFDEFCATTAPLELDTTSDLPPYRGFAVEILQHTGEWVTGRCDSPRHVDTDAEILFGTSGGPVITTGGKLFGIVSTATRPGEALSKWVSIARPDLDAPVESARRMMPKKHK